MRLPMIALLALAASPCLAATHPAPVRTTSAKIWKDPDKWSGKWVTITDCQMFVGVSGGVFCGIVDRSEGPAFDDTMGVENQILLDPMTSDFHGIPRPKYRSSLDIDSPKPGDWKGKPNKACEGINLPDDECAAEVTGIFGMQYIPIPARSGASQFIYASSAKLWHATIKAKPHKD